MELIHRTDPQKAMDAYVHVHNEYLELLVEAGIPGLVLGVLAVGLLVLPAWRAATRSDSLAVRGLAVGALFALTATAVHAFAEFGLHIPAIAVLVAVIGAQVAGLGDDTARQSGGRSAPKEERTDRYIFRLWGLAPLLGAVTAVALGLVLIGSSYRANLVQRYLAAARQAQKEAAEAAQQAHQETEHKARTRQRDYLDMAARIAPDHAQVRADAAQAHLEAYDAWKQLDIAGKTLSNSGQEKEMVRSHLVPGLRHALQARDLCPTLPRPHVLIANHVEQLARADSRASYLERATFLLPFDPEIWYFRGLQEYLSGQLDQACSSWRHSLELSDRRLPEILRTCAGRLSSREIIDHVLPRKADLLVATAMASIPSRKGWDSATRSAGTGLRTSGPAVCSWPRRVPRKPACFPWGESTWPWPWLEITCPSRNGGPSWSKLCGSWRNNRLRLRPRTSIPRRSSFGPCGTWTGLEKLSRQPWGGSL